MAIEGVARSGVSARSPTGSDAKDPFDPDENGPFPVHGLAVPEDGLTFGKNEQWVFWPESVGRDAEGLLTGRNIIDLHPEEPTNDDVVGEITGERYIDGLGLAWSGEVDSRKRAKQIHRGRLDGSPYLSAFDGGDRSKLPEGAPDGTVVASGISGFRDIGLVPDGAVSDSEAKPGPHPEIENDGGVQAALSEGFGEGYKSTATEQGSMSDSDGSDSDASVEKLKERIEELEQERDRLQAENQTLREPYVNAVVADTNLSAEQVSMDAEELAEYFDGNGANSGADGGPSAGEGEGQTSTEEGQAALSSAPLTAARGSPAGSGSGSNTSGDESGGSVVALSDGDTGTREVEVPDESLEVLEERKRVMGSRMTDEKREKLNDAIEAKKAVTGGGN